MTRSSCSLSSCLINLLLASHAAVVEVQKSALRILAPTPTTVFYHSLIKNKLKNDKYLETEKIYIGVVIQK
jgi:hypothetical protein